MEIKVVKNILAQNESIAEENQRKLKGNGVFAVNIMSSPGSGKTTVLERTMGMIKDEFKVGIVEGDICTTADADRLKKFGIQIVQINTEPFGGDCHLEAHMLQRALDCLDLSSLELLLIENLGNLVCPAEFRLGADRRVAILSITEGEDKPLKYPLIFRVADLLLINKIDLVKYLEVDVQQIIDNVAKINPDLPIIKISAKSGEGFDQWKEWLVGGVRKKTT
jgi:hydrogenase nickel incorporation protein HypB